MGLFRKHLTDARALIERGDVEGAFRILDEHTKNNCIVQTNSALVRLQRYIERYRTALINATSATSNHMGISKEQYARELLEAIAICEDCLDKIKREINGLRVERIKLE